MNEEKIKAVLEVIKDAYMKLNAMADSLAALAQAAKKSNLDLFAVQTMMHQKEPDPKPETSDPESGEKKEQK